MPVLTRPFLSAILGCCSFLLSSCSSTQSAPSTPKEIVYPVAIGSGMLDGEIVEKYDTIAVFDFADAPSAPNSGKMASATLLSLLGSAGLAIVERTKLDQVYFEQIQALSADAKALQMGRIAGAKAVVFGEVTEWKQGSNGTKVSLNARFVDVETGKILYSVVGYWPKPVQDTPQQALSKLLLVVFLRLSRQIGAGDSAIGAVVNLKMVNGMPRFVVTRVEPRLPAEAAGLKAGDIIIECNGSPAGEWKTKIQYAKGCHSDGGRPVSLKIDRQGQSLPFVIPGMKLLRD